MTDITSTIDVGALQSHNDELLAQLTEALDKIYVLRGEIAELRGMDICQDCGGDGGMGVLCATCSNSGYVPQPEPQP